MRLILILILGVFVFFSNINGTSIYILDEAKNSTAALEMMQNDEWIVPTVNGELRTDKPSLHYYFMILGYKIFGVNPLGARFFSGVMGLLTLLITFLFTNKFYNKKTAFLTGLILITSLHFSYEFHLAVPDPYLIFFTITSIFCFYIYKLKKSRFFWLLFYVSIGFGVLTKGPIAIALPGGIIFFYLIFTGQFNWKTIWNIQPFLGLFISLLIAAPWYYMVGVATNGDWIEGFLFKHNISRFTETMEGHHSFFVLPLIFTFVGLLPFSVFIISSFKNIIKNRKSEKLNFYLLIGSLFIVLFFCISQTFLPNYTLPAYPLIAILIADYLNKVKFKALNSPLIVLIILSLLIPIAAYLGIKQDASISELTIYASLFLMMPAGVIISYYFYRKGSENWIYILSSGFIATFLLVQFVLMPLADQENPVVKTKDQLKNQKVYYYKRLNASYYFYLDRPIPKLETEKDIRDKLDLKEPFYLITRKKYAERIDNKAGMKRIFQQKDLFEGHVTTIYYFDVNTLS